MKKILLVDDEIQILKALCRVFMGTEYEIITAGSGQAALEILRDNSFDLILTDMRMPYMDGYELLTQVKALYPNIIRMILSGYSDEKIVFQALQKNIAKLYIMKPWDNKSLLKVIEQVFLTEEILASANLLTLINRVEHLPTIEESYQRIIQLIDKESDLSKIASEVERDQSITSKILHVANSAYFNAKTGSIKQAINYIGIQNTRNLVLSTSIMQGFNAKGIFLDEIKIIWNHAFTTSKLLNFIYQKHLNKKLPEELSTIGLLHNIGMVLLLSNYGKGYLEHLLKALEQKKSILEFERELYHVTHYEVGSYLLKWWDFPYAIVEATMYHHNPLDEKVTNSELVCALHIAQRYAWNLMEIETYETFDLGAFDKLNITIDSFENSLTTFK